MPRIFEPRPRPTLVLAPAPTYGPLVTPIGWTEGDRAIAQYFWTSTGKDEDAWTCDESDVIRVIRFGMKAQPVPHGTPLGHDHLTVLAERIPVPTAEQMLRHRVQDQTPDGDSFAWVEWSPNVSKKSMRYVDGAPVGGEATDHADVTIDDVFYVVLPDRWRSQSGRPGAYTYSELDVESGMVATSILEGMYRASWDAYQHLRSLDIAPEQARFVLCSGVMTRLYATASYRNWFNWLVQRNDSHTQGETQLVAVQVEAILAQCCPLTYDLWTEYGRRPI